MLFNKGDAAVPRRIAQTATRWRERPSGPLQACAGCTRCLCRSWSLPFRPRDSARPILPQYRHFSFDWPPGLRAVEAATS